MKTLFEDRFPLPQDKQLLLSKPLYNVDSDLYNPFSPSQNNNPVKSWNTLIDKIPTFSSQSVFFEEAPNTVSFYWNYFIQNYEWSDVDWLLKKCKLSCYIDLQQTELEISKLEQLINQATIEIQNCKEDTDCISINNQLFSIYNYQLDHVKQRYNDERSKLIALEGDNYDSKVFQNVKRVAKAKASDSKEFFTVNFEPMNFAEILFTNNPLFLESMDIQNWDTLHTFSFYNFYFCNFTISNETVQQLPEYNELISIALKQQASQISIISQSTINDFTCQPVNISMEVGVVTLERAWFDPMLWELSDGVAVSKVSKLEWSNGNWNGTFPATISNFIITKKLEMYQWTDDPSVNGSSLLIYKQQEPKILAWMVQQVPSFPKLDSSFILDEKMRNGTASNSNLEVILQSVQNSSKSVYTETFDLSSCCSQVQIRPNCPVTLFKYDEETLPRLFQVIQFTNQSSLLLKIIFEENYFAKSQQFYTLLVFLLLLIVFTLIWPCCSGTVLLASIRNSVLLKKREDKQKSVAESSIQQRTVSRAQIVQALSPRKSMDEL